MKIRKIYSKKYFVVGLMFLATVFLLMLSMRYGNDFYWHIKAGEVMLKNHAVLKTDIFSWYLSSLKPVWISHEWLFEVILYGGSLLFGKYTGFIFTLFSFLILFGILFITNRKGIEKNFIFTVYWLFASLVFTLNTLPRPFLFSNIFLAFTIFLLYDLKRQENSKKIYFIPLIAFFWANIHGGSSNLSYLLIFIFYFCGLFTFQIGKVTTKPLTKLQQRKYLIVLFLSILAICINPHGFKMLMYPYENMGNLFMLQTIGEWQPTNFNNSSGILYILILVGVLISLLSSRKRIELTDLILILAFAFLGFKSIRFWPLTYICFTYVVFNYIEHFELSKRYYICFEVCSLVLIVGSILMWSLPRLEKFDSKLIKMVKQENPQRLYNSYDYGGYLIYSDIPVFIDGRADLYTNYNYQDYYNLSVLNGRYEELLKKYDFDYFLIDQGSPLAYYLSIHDKYQLLYEKDNIVFFKVLESTK